MKEKIDLKIKNLVSILNRFGIPTTGSCEGHIDHGSPVPWVKINSDKGLSFLRVKELRNKITSLLKVFYENRKVQSTAKLRIKSGKAGFWLYSGQDFLAWRKIVDNRAKMIATGHKIEKEIVGHKEQVRRKSNLPVFQEEIRLFGEFLKKLRK